MKRFSSGPLSTGCCCTRGAPRPAPAEGSERGGAEDEASRLGDSGSRSGGASSKRLEKVGCLGASSAGDGGGSGDPRPRPAPEKEEKDGMVGEEGITGSPRPRPPDAGAEKRSAPSSSGMGLPGARGCPEGGRPLPRPRPRPRPTPPPPPPMPEKEEKAAA
uniref:Uncharacterized protein n=1 Tax=Arundo donax TaxID=35708 RepID=A0A0A9E6P3_ARUDO